MFFKLALLFIVLPFIELAILVKLGSEIGFWDTILIVIFTGLLGAALARWQGLTVWLNIQQELQRGVMPAEQMIDGLLIFAAGLVLLTPGLITDFLGILLLIPPSRAVFKRWIKNKFVEMSDRKDTHITIFLQ